MWLLADGEFNEILFADPNDILKHIKSTGKVYRFRWIPVYEPPKESDEPNVKLGKTFEVVPLSRSGE